MTDEDKSVAQVIAITFFTFVILVISLAGLIIWKTKLSLFIFIATIIIFFFLFILSLLGYKEMLKRKANTDDHI